MRKPFLSSFAILLLVAAVLPAAAMELAWTRPAAQFRTEATPLVADLDDDGAVEVLSVNLGGQVLLWEADGTPIGTGQDGMIAQLPEGRWTSQPVQLFRPEGPLFVFGSVEGNLVALDSAWAVAWQHALGAETTWSRAVPAVVDAGGKTLVVIGDASGKITALDATGAVAWSTALEGGPSRAMVKAWTDSAGKTLLLASAGDTLFALDTTGAVVWQRALGGEIISQAEVFATPESTQVLCGTRAGSLFALNPGGEIAWEAKVGGEIDTSITFLPREGKAPLILCAGVWGNLHAIEPDGTRAWTHIFDTKNRARPLVVDANGDGALDVLVATYDQRLLVFNTEGLLIDEVRLSGAVNASPVLVPGAKAGESDVVVFSNVLLAHRLRPGLPVSPYGAGGEAESAYVSFRESRDETIAPCVVLGGLGKPVRLNVIVKRAGQATEILGTVTSRSQLEMPLPGIVDRSVPFEVTARVETLDGRLLHEAKSSSDTLFREELEFGPRQVLPSLAYSDFKPDRLLWEDIQEDRFDKVSLEVLVSGGEPPFLACVDGYGPGTIKLSSLYHGEVGHDAFVLTGDTEKPLRFRVTLDWPKRPNGARFGGKISLRELVPVDTVNVEEVPDALVNLGSDGTILVPADRLAKVWVSADTRGAEPGGYLGEVTVQPLDGGAATGLAIWIQVRPLRLPDKFPLTLCTWDYIPNQWFPNNPEAVLDGMGDHGVNVFPRTTVPTATADANGALTIDWTALDAELERLKGRGELLLQVAEPPITWAEGFPEDGKRAVKVAYLHQLRDHMKERGWDYDDYALYPVDDPGLDYGPRVPIYVYAAELFREADPKFRIYTDPVPGLSWRDFERIDPLVDVWCPNMRLVTGLIVGDPRIQRIMDSDKPVWSYECVSQVKSLSPLAYNRANAWRAWHFGLDGIGLWTFSTTQADHWLANADKNDEYALVYPGEMPVSSVRWEALRDGLEDVAAMAMLKERIEANRNKPDKADLVKEAEDALRIATVDVMEMSAPAFIESRDFRAQGNRRIWHTRTDELLFRMHRDQIARLTMELGE
jgi:outer membrane protein assembly factor BamB